MARPRILLVNPPIYDFTAYDFWMRPYGMLRVAGRLSHACDLTVFDFLVSEMRDAWGRGRFRNEAIPKPSHFKDIPRRFRRFGRKQSEFRQFLESRPFDTVLVQTMMTYWYPGVREVIEDVRCLQPAAKIVLGGIYATLCPEHARSLGPDLVVEAAGIDSLFNLIGVSPREGLPHWNGCLRQVGVVKLTEGCPFRCTYCSVPLLYQEFSARDPVRCVTEIRYLTSLGAKHVAFYDDALLFKPEACLIPVLRALSAEQLPIAFHTPNALNARLLTPELASLMVKANIKTFFLGLENTVGEWQRGTGGKVNPVEFEQAVVALKSAGARSVTAYVLLGHPDAQPDHIEETMDFAAWLGVRILLSEFAPVPGSPDAERSRPWADLSEPLSHNKTAFAIRRLGAGPVNRLKQVCRSLNEGIL